MIGNNNPRLISWIKDNWYTFISNKNKHEKTTWQI